MSHPFKLLPSSIRDSALIKALETKLPTVTGASFNYAAELCRLYDDVKPEVARMALLFPEYTPHDTDFHLDRLFPLAEKLLGPEFFEALTCDELFLLAIGLIAHDWGMAVSDKEINALISGGQLPETEQEGFALLDNESHQLGLYIQERRLPRDGDKFPALTQPASPTANETLNVASDVRYAMKRSPLPEYVRRTHAWRSGARLKRRWGSAYPALAEAAAEVCIGHWLDLSKIDIQNPFAAPRPLFGHSQPPNLRAVALAVRLTDLFDIGIDRTPYALWRYIRPQDTISSQEWDKHRCLDPVVIEPDAHGQRAPVLSGTVSDHRVWAAIMDLHRYCNEQLRGCADIMRRHELSDSLQRGYLLPWKLRTEVSFKVKAAGFKPVDIRFEFDRRNILHLLSSLLYQGDAYVFLRELLQNAIDATRLRRARHRVEAENDPNSRPPRGIIYFEVKHGDDGDATIICRDSGIGMDEVTVRNYLAKAGVSFWQSDHFQSMDPGFTPIGCFGIGMLSCFSVADEVEFLTRRYDWPDPKTDPLRIQIPDASQQFRVEQAPDTTPFGTSVTVHVQGRKLRELWCARHAAEAAKMSEKEHPAPPLKVTEYLKRIAGFVRFPIVVDEDGKRTVIVHPDYELLPETEEDGNALGTLEKDATTRGQQWAIHRLAKDYGWSTIIKSHFANAPVKPSQRVVDLKKDLGPEMTAIGINGIEGWLIYAEPTDLWSEFDFRGGELKIVSPFRSDLNEGISDDRNVGYTTRLYQESPNGIHFDNNLDSPSSMLDNNRVVYRDGLLVSGLRKVQDWGGWIPIRGHHRHLLPVMAINLPATSPHKFEPSRLSFNGVDQNWYDFLSVGVHNWLARTQVIEKILASTEEGDQRALQQRFFSLGRLIICFGLKSKWVGSRVPAGEFPVPRIYPNGHVDITLAKNLASGIHWIAPHATVFDPNWAWNTKYYQSDESETKCRAMVFLQDTCLPSLDDSFGMAAGSAWDACIRHLMLDVWPRQCRWLVPPVGWLEPVHQIACYNVAQVPNFKSLAEQIFEDPNSVLPSQLHMFLQEVTRLSNSDNTFSIYPFPQPFAGLFAGDNGSLNSLHASVQWLMRVFADLLMRSAFNSHLPDSDETWGSLISKLAGSVPPHGQGLALEPNWMLLSRSLERSGYMSGYPAPPLPESNECYLPCYTPDDSRPSYDTENDEGYHYPAHCWGHAIPPDWKPGDVVETPPSHTGSIDT